MRLWDEGNLKGEWLVTVKIDGVNAIWDGKAFNSRRGKPLYNANDAGERVGAKEGEAYEIFCGNFKETISIVRSSVTEKRPVTEFELFDLEPEIDPRLVLCKLEDPTEEEITGLFEGVLSKGYEGLVLRGENGERLKVKDKITLDLIVTGMTEGKGRNKDRCGALITSRGKVSGMSDEERTYFWDFPDDIIGTMIEAECMELTEKGMMRHGRFLRLRYDKPLEENDDQ